MSPEKLNKSNHIISIKPRLFVIDSSGESIKRRVSQFSIQDIEESSKDTTNRVEMLWNNKIESLFRFWADECKENSEKHRKASRKNKILYNVFGIPAIIIPIFMSSVNQFYEKQSTEVAILVNSIGYFLTGMLTGINTFVNYSSLYERHNNSEYRYNELYTDIQSVLIKPKRDRIPADVCLETFKLKFEHIKEFAPDI